MLKWVGRILYVVIVFLFISTVGLGDGIVLSEYYENVVLSQPEDYDFTISTYLGMDHSYWQKDSLLEETIVVNHEKSGINIQFELDIFPLGSSKTNFEDNLIFDGLVFMMTNIDNSDGFVLSHFSVKFQVLNTITNEKSDLYTKDNNYQYVIIPPSNVDATGTPKGLVFITERSMKNADPKNPAEAEYEILTIDIFAHGYLEVDEDRNDQNLHMYKGYNNGNIGGGNPAVTDSNLVIERDNYMLSKITNITEEPTEAEMLTYNLGYIRAEYGPYIYWYWIVAVLYILLIIVIPYFWFFHAKVMENYRTRQRVKKINKQRQLERENLSNNTIEAEYTDKK